MARDFDNILMENARFTALNGYKRSEKKLSANLTMVEDIGNEDNVYSIMLSKGLFLNSSLQAEVEQSVKNCIKNLLKRNRIKKRDLVLVVGVGNDGMTADALGPETLENLEITEHLYMNKVNLEGRGRIACIKSSVSGVTGIQSYDIIKGVVNEIKPALIIVVDTLSSKRVERLARVIQISDKGIVPGSGVGNAKKSLDQSTLGVPVIAIGVPLVIYAKNIVSEYLASTELPTIELNKDNKLATMVVTVKDIDIAVEDFGSAIGLGISQAIHR
ncbi:MAG: GPR endopeptidase [Bacillota bacterium]